MYSLIYGNIDRQARALALLGRLLQEEFELLCARNTDEVMNLEFSIHELLRQIANEKDFMGRLLGGGRLRDYISMLGEEQAEPLNYLFNIVDSFEQRCSRQATNNCELSLALLDTSTETLNFLHDKLMPKDINTYGRAGAYVNSRPEATLISGRL